MINKNALYITLSMPVHKRNKTKADHIFLLQLFFAQFHPFRYFVQCLFDLWSALRGVP